MVILVLDDFCEDWCVELLLLLLLSGSLLLLLENGLGGELNVLDVLSMACTADIINSLTRDIFPSSNDKYCLAACLNDGVISTNLLLPGLDQTLITS
tara:strand:+ start:273 stop:563 length:291 start_codon:yes stop_codon:yes gene_type:complete